MIVILSVKFNLFHVYFLHSQHHMQEHVILLMVFFSVKEAGQGQNQITKNNVCNMLLLEKNTEHAQVCVTFC